jgi:hypothetical protein
VKSVLRNGDFVASFEDGIFDSTQEVAKRYNFNEADVPSILNYLNFANWVDIFGTGATNTCVSLFSLF